MKIRIARHTSHLEPVIHFYADILGLENLGSFENHSGYDGVFLGLPGENWHLEFTVSEEKPDRKPDHDDLLVLYIESKNKYEAMISRFTQANINQSEAKNPYWKKNGSLFLDPDGFGVMLVKDF